MLIGSLRSGYRFMDFSLSLIRLTEGGHVTLEPWRGQREREPQFDDLE